MLEDKSLLPCFFFHCVSVLHRLWIASQALSAWGLEPPVLALLLSVGGSVVELLLEIHKSPPHTLEERQLQKFFREVLCIMTSQAEVSSLFD